MARSYRIGIVKTAAGALRGCTEEADIQFHHGPLQRALCQGVLEHLAHLGDVGAAERQVVGAPAGKDPMIGIEGVIAA